MEECIRFGVSLPRKMLERFDKDIEKKGYTNKTLLAEVPLHEGIVEFLKEQGVNIIMIKAPTEEKRIG